MKKSLITVIGTILIFFVFMVTGCPAKKAAEVINKPSVKIGGEVVTVEIADTQAKRTAGLMTRKHLAPDAGMLFIFDEPTEPVFWMKDCFISLDIIFIKGNKIVNMYTDVPPCPEDTICDQYPSAAVVDKVLEVNAGFAKKHDVKINDEVEFVGFRF